MSRIVQTLAPAALILVALGAGQAPAAQAVPAVHAVTPAGITLQFIDRAKGKGAFFSHRTSALVAYADSRGMPLYWNDVQKPAVCEGPCAASWTPALAPMGVTPAGDWSLMAGSRQWAFKGRALYTCAKDEEVAVATCDATDGKQLAVYEPGKDFVAPPTITVKEVVDMDALLLADGQGRALYRYNGDVKDIADVCATPACKGRFVPVPAPELARPIGTFAPLTRGDGVIQWTYGGKPLFTFDGDLDPGAVRGRGLSARWEPVVVAAHFKPESVGLIALPGRGTIWATSAGMTVYRRDAHHHIASGRGIARSDLPAPTAGLSIGTKGCDAACLKTWQPLTAAADAVPSGYWGIYTRDDGARQWAYKGYALYTYTNDKAPHDIKGAGLYDVFLDEGDGKFVDPGIAAIVNPSTPALYWTYAEP